MNKEILDDEMIVSDDNGDEKVMKILFTDEKNKTLEEIEDEEEYKEAEEVLNAFDLDKTK